jgi:hypothetical protein
MDSFGRWSIVALVLGSTGCGAQTLETQPGAPPARTAQPAATASAETGTVWSECYSMFQPTGDVRGDLSRLTRNCGPTGGMRAVTPVQIGQQSEKDPADRYTFYVANPGSCYRVYATGDRGVQDLDLLLRGPDGDEVVADLTHDAFPVLPPQNPLCFASAGLYMLEVSVFRGAGRYAVQVWGNPDGLTKTPAAAR